MQVYVVGAVLAFAGYRTWRRNMKAAQLIEATATSRVATAAKGYAELVGIAKRVGETPLVADPIRGTPCLWYRFVTEERSGARNRHWRVVDRGASIQPFTLQDDSGLCLIAPDEAQIADDHDPDEVVRVSSSRRHRIWRIRENDPLYALGFLERRAVLEAAGEAREIEITEGARKTLRLWKGEQAKLLERFDENRDGRIDAAEWEKARQAARASATAEAQSRFERQRSEAAARADAHIEFVLQKADDGRPLLISNRNEVQFLGRMKKRSWLGLFLFCAGVLMVVVNYTQMD